MPTTQIETVSPTKKKINVHVAKDDIAGYLKRAYQKVGSRAKLKGFRPGKVPANVLDQYYGQEIDMECLNVLVDEAYTHALNENSIVPLTKPKFDVGPFDRAADYKFAIEIEVKPQFELKNYTGWELKKTDDSVTEAELDEELKHLRERMAELAPAPEGDKLKNGQVAVIDFAGKIDGIAFPGGEAKDFQLEQGTGRLLKDFEDQINGMSVGETREISVPFPGDYFEKSLAGKTASFTVTLKSLHDKKLPNLDEDFAKDVGVESLQKLKDEIKNALSARKRDQAKGGHVEEIKTRVLKEYSFEVPEGLLEQGEKTQQRPVEDLRNTIRFEFVLEAIAVKENLKPEAEDLERRLATYAQIYRKPISEVRQIFLKNNMFPHLMTQALLDKAIDFIINNAKMV